ncbi:MAG: hypothetical protein CGW95_16390 [Phenylobacterium zucineum]|nr:MAG: hypothetical protein CGW95_16390 [Phenylobacterium zucineum]
MSTNPLAQINLQDERLSTLEAVALAKIMQKFEQYTRQGRAGDAHGAGTAALILWLTLTEGHRYETGWSSI